VFSQLIEIGNSPIISNGIQLTQLVVSKIPYPNPNPNPVIWTTVRTVG